jgi:hypothetical protein
MTLTEFSIEHANGGGGVGWTISAMNDFGQFRAMQIAPDTDPTPASVNGLGASRFENIWGVWHQWI